MSQFTKIAAALFLVFGLFSAVAPSSAQARDMNFGGSSFGSVEHAHHYHVYYGTCPHHMHLYGTYDCPVEAQEVAQSLRWNGYTVRVSAH